MNRSLSESGALIASAALTAGLLGGAPVYAQTGSAPEVRRPYRGIFAGGSQGDSPNSLSVSASAFAAYDDNVYEALTNDRSGSPWLQESGGYQGGSTTLTYGFDTGQRRFIFGGQAGGQLYYYRHHDESDLVPSSQADVALTGQLTKSLALTVRQSIAYSSTYNTAVAPTMLGAGTPGLPSASRSGRIGGVDQPEGPVLPGAEVGHQIGVVGDPQFDLFEVRALRTATTVSVTQKFGRYLAVAGAYNFRSRDVRESDESSAIPDYSTHSGFLALSYQRPMSRYAALRLGYGIRLSDGANVTGEPDRLHSVDVGVDYARPLSFSRRTSFSFSTGSAIATRETASPSGDQRRTWVRLIGQASLVHEMGRTWTARLSYVRGFNTRDGFNELYFTDLVTTALDGLVSRRLSFSAAAVWADSSLEYQSSGRQRGQSASARATYAFGRFVGVYTQYVYYRYRYPQGAQLDARFPSALDRQGIRVGIDTSLPLIR